MQPHPNETAGGTDASMSQSEALFDVEYMRHLAGFVLRSVKQHRRTVFAVAGGVLALTALAFSLAPRLYLAETKLFAQRNFVMPALNNPRRAVPLDSDSPTRLASEAVLRRDNLVAIITQTNLMAEWRASRPAMKRLKDRLVTLIGDAPTEAEQMDALIGMLERHLWVIPNEGTVIIGVQWPDAASAFHIVEAAQRNFLEGRHASEVATIRESIAILENQAADVHRTIEQGYAELRRDAPAARTLAGAATRPRRSAAAESEISSLRKVLATRRLAIRDLEDFQRRRLAELQARLAEQRNTFGPAHPALAATERSIKEISTESPQLVELRADEQRIVGDLRRLGVDADSPSPEAAPTIDQSLARAALASIERGRDDSVRAERDNYIRTRVQMSEHEFEDLEQRLQGARIELETARAAFKYRYGVVSPAQIPRRPVSPHLKLFVVGGVALAMALSLFVALALDIGRGRVLEVWQVERVLGLPVLGEVPPQ